MQSNRPTALLQDVLLSCLDPQGRPVSIRTTLSYRRDDPYAVTLTFHSKSSGDVDWLVARSLLLQGLAMPVGEGDVRIFPSIDETARAVTVLEFTSPDGTLVGQVGSGDLHRFLRRTFEVVPPGDEFTYLDLDGLVEALLAPQR